MPGRLTTSRRRWPALDVVVEVVQKGGRDSAGRLAALVAYFSFFSLFPLMLVLVSVIGLLLDGSMEDAIVDSALANFPVLGTDIAENVGAIQGSGWAFAIGVVTALWAGTHALDALEHAMHVVSKGADARPPNILQRRLRALMLVAVLGLALLASTALGIIAGSLSGIPFVARPAGLLLSVASNAAVMMLVYQVSMPERHPWRSLAPGGLTAGVGLTALYALGGVYVRVVVQGASDTYGVFAVVIGLLSWLQLIASVVIWSAELNSVLAARAESDVEEVSVGPTVA